MKVQATVEVSKEIYELSTGLAEFIGAVQGALADGWQIGSDLPVVVMATIHKLVPAMQGVEQIGAEFKEDKGAAVLGALVPLVNAIGKLVK
jgi:hypothetical protein